VPQPPDTALYKRTQETPRIAPDARPMYRTNDGFANDGENPGAGAEGATIGRNMPIVPEDSREDTDYPCALPNLQQDMTTRVYSSLASRNEHRNEAVCSHCGVVQMIIQ
jgi:hypothetical protein